MNPFIVLGVVCVVASYAYIPPKQLKELFVKTPAGIYGAFRAQLPRRPVWAWALLVLGLALCVLGYWRQWSGA